MSDESVKVKMKLVTEGRSSIVSKLCVGLVILKIGMILKVHSISTDDFVSFLMFSVYFGKEMFPLSLDMI